MWARVGIVSRWNAAHPEYPAWARVLEIVGIVAFIGLAGAMGYTLLGSIQPTLWALIKVALAVAVGFVLADLFSGVVHFWCDHVGREDLPFIGPVFVKHFIAHHHRPQEILEHDFIETNGNNFLASTVLLMPGYLAWMAWGHPGSVAFFVGFYTLCCFQAIANQSHKWAHLSRTATPRVVRIAQACGLTLSREGHGRHHRKGFGRSFCITTGVLNPILDRTPFFAVLGYVFRSLGAWFAKPRVRRKAQPRPDGDG